MTSEAVKLLLVLLLSLLCAASLRAQNPDIVLRGSITHADNQTYKLLPFTVPEGVSRITITFAHTGQEQKTVFDLGLMAPDGFRGWSGGRAGPFTVSETDASPSYLPGRIAPGVWNLLVGIPNIRPNVTASYVATIHFSRTGAPMERSTDLYPRLDDHARWYRGDLHMHTGHSDGSCNSQNGNRVPCPVFLSVDAAARRGLDFIAITDHNTRSQYDEMRELQPYFDRVLLIPGQEITTFQGHANVFGTTAFIDFRVTSADVPNWNTVLQRVRALGALVSLNHPDDPTGEICMGCGWRADPPVDMHLVNAVEAVNGTAAEGPTSGIPFWENQLNQGFRLTAVGGSDNHNALAPLPGPGSIGYPTTVVFAPELSISGILEGIRRGRVFIDITGSTDRLLDISARSGESTASMGASLDLARGAVAEFTVHAAHVNGGRVEMVEDGSASRSMSTQPISLDDQSFTFEWHSDGERHWIRANVRDAEGRLVLVGNPIYINFEGPGREASATF